MAKILILNGPNLNMLGTREPLIYGSKTLNEIHENIKNHIRNSKKDIEAVFYQSNSEGDIVNCIQDSKNFQDPEHLQNLCRLNLIFAVRQKTNKKLILKPPLTMKRCYLLTVDELISLYYRFTRQIKKLCLS